jgi:hypothetical protein
MVENLMGLGAGKLQASQRDFVIDHMATCAWCHELHGGEI